MRIKTSYKLSEIKTGLYTDGTEYETEDGIPYVGMYHQYTSTGEIYTEETWSESESQPLKPINTDPEIVTTYKQLNPGLTFPTIPQNSTRLKKSNLENINIPPDIN